MRTLTVLFVSLLLTGCSVGDLIIRDQDSGDIIAGKVTARILSCGLTVCLSELVIADIKDNEERARQRQQWFNSLSPMQQHQVRAEEAAALQALGLALIGPKPPGVPLMPSYAPQVAPVPVPRTCMSNPTGGGIYATTCY